MAAPLQLPARKPPTRYGRPLLLLLLPSVPPRLCSGAVPPVNARGRSGWAGRNQGRDQSSASPASGLRVADYLRARCQATRLARAACQADPAPRLISPPCLVRPLCSGGSRSALATACLSVCKCVYLDDGGGRPRPPLPECSVCSCAGFALLPQKWIAKFGLLFRGITEQHVPGCKSIHKWNTEVPFPLLPRNPGVQVAASFRNVLIVCLTPLETLQSAYHTKY